MDREFEILLEQLADKIKYGKIVVEFTCSRGCIVKAVIKETEKVILFDKKT